jgi:hypothetical protein
MLALPERADTSAYRAFALALCALGGGGAAWLLGVVWGLSAALAASALAVVVATSGFAWPRSVRPLYTFWDRAARKFSRLALAATLRVIFYIVIAAVGRAGERMQLSAPAAGASLWNARETRDPATYGSESAGAEATPSASWALGFARWAVRTRQPWALCLLPFLWLVRCFDSERRTLVQSNVYTLY